MPVRGWVGLEVPGRLIGSSDSSLPTHVRFRHLDCFARLPPFEHNPPPASRGSPSQRPPAPEELQGGSIQPGLRGPLRPKDHQPADYGTALPTATLTSRIFPGAFVVNNLVQRRNKRLDMLNRVCGMRSMEGRGRGENLNRPATIPQAEHKILVLHRP